MYVNNSCSRSINIIDSSNKNRSTSTIKKATLSTTRVATTKVEGQKHTLQLKQTTAPQRAATNTSTVSTVMRKEHLVNSYFDQFKGESLMEDLVDLGTTRQLPFSRHLSPASLDTVLKVDTEALHHAAWRNKEREKTKVGKGCCCVLFVVCIHGVYCL